MSKIKIDAIEVATSIRKGDFSKLRGKFFEMCDNLGMGKRYTLNQLGMTVDKLVVTVNDLAKEMRDGFKRVNARIDLIEERLDYNNLKKLPEIR